MTIKTLFDTSKDIYRTIEKVITYNASQEARLKAEITEYIVTDSIEEQFERLLTKMQFAMEAGGENEIGVWVSGFYGSGKSSFTKYLGLAMDERVTIDGTRFLKYLQDRMKKAQTRALLSKVAKDYPMAVVLLDLASEMLAGATMEEVSTVLYYKVLQWAGYSRNLKVAAFERRLKKDGRYEDFTARIQNDLGVDWCEVQNDPLVIDSLIPEIAHELYPTLFKSTSAFNTEAADFVLFENERVKEMIEIVREATGKPYVLFIIDEVGQYVSSRPNLILNLDGLAKNLKHIGGGKAWIFGTAQQTLTEDDPRASLNSPELYKLKDRFPIQIDLESSDIKEICTRRLLGKSTQGEKTLAALYTQHGQALRHNTRLQDAKYYDADFGETDFINLYPFLPAHFDILLHLLGALAKSTGGIGLRSAIKVIQDILIEGPEGQPPVADRPVGWLATTVTLYDSLEKDIRRAESSIYKAVAKALLRFPDSPVHQEVAKTVAVLQILGNMPVTAHNVASLTHPGVAAASRLAEIEATVQDLINDGIVPFGEKDGNLCFFSEKINDIDQERSTIPLRSIETRRIQNEALRAAFNPLPATKLNNTLTVTTGLKTASGGNVISLAGDKDTIQTVVEFVAPEDYDIARTRLIDESRQRIAQYQIFLLGRTTPEINNLVAEIYRSREIANRYRSDPDQEIKEYCVAQTDRANKLAGDLEHLLASYLGQGSFIFRGQVTASDSPDHKLLEAAKKHLAGVAEQVFDRYTEASVRADTTLAEKFLRQSNLRTITSETDPLGLVQVVSGSPRINGDQKALTSIRDFIERNGSVDGKRLTDYFTDAPFGWSADTLRYLVAALLVKGEIILKISGREIKVPGQQAIEALRTNNSFKPVGVSLREAPLAPELLARAAERLTELTGDSVYPLEQDISKSAVKHFPQLQLKYGPLVTKLENLGLPGVEKVRELNHDLAEILATDASDVPQRLGAPDSALYTSLKWAADVTMTLNQGLENTIHGLREHWKEIRALPDYGIPGDLKAKVKEALEQIGERLEQDSFYQHDADLNNTLTIIENLVRTAVEEMATAQKATLKDARQDLAQVKEWSELNVEEQGPMLAQLDELETDFPLDLSGLKKSISQGYAIQAHSAALKRDVAALGRQRAEERWRDEEERARREGRSRVTRSLNFSTRATTIKELEDLIAQLQALKDEMAQYIDIEVTFHLKD